MIPQRTLTAQCEISTGSLLVTQIPPMFTGESAALQVQVELKYNDADYTPAAGVVAEMYLYFPNTENMTRAVSMTINGNICTGVLPASSTGLDGYPLLVIQLTDTATGSIIVAASVQVHLVKSRGKQIVTLDAPNPSEVVYIGKSPYVDPTTGHWMQWDVEDGYIDTGITAKGDKGDKGDAGSVISVDSLMPDGAGNVQLTGDVTVTGNPVNVDIKKLQVSKQTRLTFEPIQDLHGYDHPWAGGAGKNFIPMEFDYIKSINSAGVWNDNVYTINGLTFTVKMDNGNNIIGITVNGTASANTNFALFYNKSINADAGMLLTGCPANGSSNTYFISVQRNSSWEYRDVGNGYTCLSSYPNTGAVIGIRSGVVASNLTFYPMLRLASESDATFEPYTNICPVNGVDLLNVPVLSKNLIPDDTCHGDGYVNGQYIQINNNTYANTGYYISEYFSVKPNTEYAWSSREQLTNPAICFYDKNKTFISGVKPNNSLPKTITTPANAVYARASNRKLEVYMFEEGSTVSEYSDYKKAVFSKAMPETVYDGTLDLETGKLVIDRVGIRLADLTYTQPDTQNGVKRWLVRNDALSDIYVNGTRRTRVISDKFRSLHNGEAVTDMQEGDIYLIYGDSTYTDLYINHNCDTGADFLSFLGDSMAYFQLREDKYRTLYLTPDCLELFKNAAHVSTNAKTIEVTYSAGEIETVDSTAKVSKEVKTLYGLVDMLINRDSTMTWKDYQKLVSSRYAERLYPVGSQIEDTWVDESSQSYTCPFDIVHYDDEGNAFLKWHWSMPDIQFDAPEAIYYVGYGGLAAGTYHIGIGANYSSGWVAGQSIQFTLSTALSEGDQIFVDCATNNANNPTASRTLRTYAKGSTTVKETTTTSNGTGGTSLGSTNSATPHRTNGRINAPSRVVYGHNRWKESAVRQFLNSDAAVNAWWAPMNPWDRPPVKLSSYRGFLNGFSEDFLSILKPVEVKTALNTIQGYSETYDITYDKFFLPSLQELYVVPQIDGVEGKEWDYYKVLAAEAGLTDKFAQSGTYEILKAYKLADHAAVVASRLRSAVRASATTTWYVITSGVVTSNGASYSYGGWPACKILKS